MFKNSIKKAKTLVSLDILKFKELQKIRENLRFLSLSENLKLLEITRNLFDDGKMLRPTVRFGSLFKYEASNAHHTVYLLLYTDYHAVFRYRYTRYSTRTNDSWCC